MLDSTLILVEHLSSISELLGAVPVLSKWMGYFWVGLQVAAGLGFVIFVHELGHFLAAKTFGVKCEKFYIGFDVPISIGPIRLPRTLGRFRWGETEYGIGIVPLGGYVKMLGQDDDPRNAEEEAQRIRLGEGADAPIDPRSYQAKPVWQRMVIISAGVIMNVIFAVFLAAAAFLFGVPYTPTIVGTVPLGSPAWEAGLQPGDKVVQVAKMKEDDPYLRFEDMGTQTIMHGLKHKDAVIPFTVERGDQRLVINTVPSNKLHPSGIYLVGINPANVAVVGDEISPFSYLAGKNIDLQPGDKIIAIDGQPLQANQTVDQVLNPQVTDAFQAKWNRPIELTVLRTPKPSSSKATSSSADSSSPSSPAANGATTSSQEFKVTLPPVPVKTLGFGFAIGPITSVQRGSLAEANGIKVGDIIEAVDGQAVTDALRLPMQVADKIGKPIEFRLRRPGGAHKEAQSNDAPAKTVISRDTPGDARASDAKATDADSDEKVAGDDAAGDQFLTVTMTSEEPPAFGSIGETSAKLGLPNFGIAYEVTPMVSIINSNFEKASSSVQVGDVLTQLKLEPTEAEIAAFEKAERKIPSKEETVSSLRTMPAFHNLFQQLPEGMKVRCYFERGSEIREIVLPLQYDESWFWIQRGVPMQPLELIQKTDNFGQAMKWGAAETGRRLGDVWQFLTILVSGRASPRNLAGPFGIAEMAANEASSSPSRLLLFLTLLSANLAILNFLPIPALDGGHLMFLIAEAIRGKPLNEALQVRLTMVGVMCLLCLMAFAILNDVLRKFM